jgi:hypothetical protein
MIVDRWLDAVAEAICRAVYWALVLVAKAVHR